MTILERKFINFSAVCVLLPIGTWFSCGYASGELGDDENAIQFIKSHHLAASVWSKNEKHYIKNLNMAKIEEGDKFAKLKRSLDYSRKHRAKGTPNVIFYIPDNDTAELEWFTYETITVGSYPIPRYIGQIVTYSETNISYVALVESRIGRLTVKIYEILQHDDTDDVIKFPKSFENFVLWPESDKAISILNMKLDIQQPCNIENIQIIPERDHLLISLQKQKCDPIYLRFELSTHEWFRVKMENEKITSDF